MESSIISEVRGRGRGQGRMPALPLGTERAALAFAAGEEDALISVCWLWGSFWMQSGKAYDLVRKSHLDISSIGGCAKFQSEAREMKDASFSPVQVCSP